MDELPYSLSNPKWFAWGVCTKMQKKMDSGGYIHMRIYKTTVIKENIMNLGGVGG